MRLVISLGILGLASTALAHDLCKDHSRPCRWKDAAKALCELDASMRDAKTAGLADDNADVVDTRHLIAHIEDDLRANVSRLQTVEAETAAAATEAQAHLALTRAALERFEHERDQSHEQAQDAVDELRRDKCLLALNVLRPVQVVGNAALQYFHVQFHRVWSELQGLALNPAASIALCKEDPKKAMKDYAYEHTGELLGELLVEKASLASTSAVPGAPAVASLVTQLSSAYVDLWEAARAEDEVWRHDEVSAIPYQFYWERAGWIAHERAQRHERARAELDLVSNALSRAECTR